ncbi:hypothetical protein PCASD_11301 [Puccinia coronata f. sp. avenae]|uniref:Uncharacterized protein n=1 Tax=Puccinia coronata f. sp. avenae TaxID=200324 RepID=A0A2N5UJF9_9BASI|nr:hypothetical protein PCASD_11301 [Puccinia coronata f. sp. avenae]
MSKHTAGINRSNTAVRAVLEQPCLTGGRTGTVRPKQEPTGWTDLSDRSRLVLSDRSQELIGQACPTRRQVLWSDSACPTTGRTRLFEHRSNCRARPVIAGSDTLLTPNLYSPPCWGHHVVSNGPNTIQANQRRLRNNCQASTPPDLLQSEASQAL